MLIVPDTQHTSVCGKRPDRETYETFEPPLKRIKLSPNIGYSSAMNSNNFMAVDINNGTIDLCEDNDIDMDNTDKNVNDTEVEHSEDKGSMDVEKDKKYCDYQLVIECLKNVFGENGWNEHFCKFVEEGINDKYLLKLKFEFMGSLFKKVPHKMDVLEWIEKYKNNK